MAIGKISGPMLFPNLERQGIDLAFESNLLYLDVTNRRVGIVNSTPQFSLDSSGNAKIANILIEGNLLSSNTGKIDFGNTSNITISGGSANYVLYTDGLGNLNWGEISELDTLWGNILLVNNTISITNLDGNLDLTANGTGKVNVLNDFYVNGNLYAANFSGNLAGNGAAFSGNVSADWFIGNIQSYQIDSSFGNITNLISSNVTISSGTISNVDAQINNLSTANILILSGEISNVTAQLNNLSTGNAFISGGILYNVDIQANNISAANALIFGGTIYNIDLQANNFSSSNVLITSGGISNVDAQVNNLSSGNVLISAGILHNVDIQSNNLSVANALINSGEISNVNAQINNLSTGNVIILSGTISNVDAQINNLSSSNILVSSGIVYNINLQANNFSTANALISGGIIYNVDIQSNNFSSANTLITGGDLSNINAQINNLSSGNVLISAGILHNVDIQANNISSSNALISGGEIYNTNNIQTNNFSTANALITSGDISNVNAQVNNFSTGNALITSGILNNVNIQANNLSTANAIVTGGYISGLSNLSADSANIGNVTIQDIYIASTTGNLVLSPLLSNSNAVVVINGTSALQLPSGTTGQQPTAYAGAIRWNNSTDSLEFFNGSVWSSLLSHIENQTIAPDGTNISYNLDYTATAEGIIVSINGTLQQPGVAYTVAGTTITFAEIPLITDTISIRYLAAGTTTAENAVEINSANVALNTGAILIDSFNMNVYRSVKYMTSTTSSLGDSEFAEFAVTQFDPIVSLSNINKAATSSSLTTITANINGPYVQVYATATSTAQMRIQKTYFIV